MPVSKAPLDFYACREKAHRIAFQTTETPAYPDWVYAYFSYYQLDFYQPHYFGSLSCADYQIAVNYFEPPDSEKTVFLLHGYLEHTGNLRWLIKELLQAKLAVVSVDLPGHGLSSGEDSSIHSFIEYGDLIESLVTKLESLVKPFYAVIGHSTGGGAVVEYLRAHESVFEKHILGAPLIRSEMWDLSKFGVAVLGGVIKTLPAWLREISHDKNYLEFSRYHDPLLRKTAAMDWVKALFEWDKLLVKTPFISDKAVYILQGKSDNVVFWKYNMEYLKKTMTASEIFYFEEARHDLFYESEEIRLPIIERVIEVLTR